VVEKDIGTAKLFIQCSMNSEMAMCYFWSSKGIKSIDDVMKKPFSIGDTSKNSGGYIYTSILRSLSGDMAKMVLGYGTTGDIWLAIERGEVDGMGYWTLSSLQAAQPTKPARPSAVSAPAAPAPTNYPPLEADKP
jgi:hypothetical protein